VYRTDASRLLYLEDRLKKLEKPGDPLPRLESIVDWKAAGRWVLGERQFMAGSTMWPTRQCQAS